jgi:hypothetical protein
VVDFETKRPRADENGEPLYVVQLIAMTDGAAEILAVKVPGQPSGLRQGHPVKVQGLVAQPWTMQDRSRGGVPRGPDRAGHSAGQGQLATGGRWSPSNREGGGRSRR